MSVYVRVFLVNAFLYPMVDSDSLILIFSRSETAYRLRSCFKKPDTAYSLHVIKVSKTLVGPLGPPVYTPLGARRVTVEVSNID